MTSPDLFFLYTITTIAITRVWLYKRPLSSPKIGPIKLHHYMYGLVIFFLGILYKNVLIYSIGFGLMIDEIPIFLFKKEASWNEYESKLVFTGVLILLVLVYIFRRNLLPHF